MQALRRSVSQLMPGVRRMGTASAENADQMWARHFPKPDVSAEQVKKNVNKELVGFAILGPVGVAFMLYDYVIGLEEEHHHPIAPYPWMRIRRAEGMPWGENGLFEKHPRVVSQDKWNEIVESGGHH